MHKKLPELDFLKKENEPKLPPIPRKSKIAKSQSENTSTSVLPAPAPSVTTKKGGSALDRPVFCERFDCKTVNAVHKF